MKKEIGNEKNEFFTSGGYVIGNMWGGGIGAYESRDYTADSLESLKKRICEDFSSGALDSGFGFERLRACKVILTRRKRIEIDGEQFYSTYNEIFSLGETELFDNFNLL